MKCKLMIKLQNNNLKNTKNNAFIIYHNCNYWDIATQLRDKILMK